MRTIATLIESERVSAFDSLASLLALARERAAAALDMRLITLNQFDEFLAALAA